MSWTVAMALAVAQANAAPIDIPYQAVPAFAAYTDCIGERLRADPGRGGDAAAVGQANAAAVAGCRDVREIQLARAIELLTDYRPHGDRAAAARAVRLAFDRFDNEFDAEDHPPILRTVAPLGDPPSPGSRQPAERRGPSMTGSLDIPDEIAPAVLPYVGCLMARDGVDVRGSFDPRPRDVARGGDCTSYRARAARDADRLLRRRGGLDAWGRAAFIERALTAIEEFHVRNRPPARNDDAPN